MTSATRDPGSSPVPWTHPVALVAWAVATWWSVVRRSEVALVYGAAVVITCLVLSAMHGDAYERAVEAFSTNLVNLKHRPWAVLLGSAFVVSSPWGLWLVPFAMLAYAVAQRWVGWAGAVIVGLFGHVGATLVVATVLAAGITRGALATSVAHAHDVGISYGLAAVASFLISRVPRRHRVPYLVLLLAYFVGPSLIQLSFTGLGHAVALALGGMLALLVARGRRDLVATSGPVTPAEAARSDLP